MDIVKKNMWSIVCGVIAVLAVLFTYWPLSGKFVELNTRLTSSVDEDNKFRQLNNTNPNMPVIDPKNSEVPKLNQFPTEKVIEKGRAAVGKVHAEAEKLAQRAMEMNKREPLVANALIIGREPFMSSFKQEYYAGLDEMRKAMGSTTIPTDDEIRVRVDEMWKNDYEPLIRKVGDVAQNEQQVHEEFELRKKEIPKMMRMERARQHLMYVNPEKPGTTPGTTNGMTTSMDYHPGIPAMDVKDLPNVIDIWQAQLGYWIEQDVVNAIAESNKGAKSVEDAIVKRLIRTDIKKEYMTKTGPLAIGMAVNASNIQAPQPGQDDAATGPQRFFGYTVTGRVCNPQYDVMHFTITVDADAQRFETFVNNLTHGKFITVIRLNVRGVDRELLQQRGYFYGKSPVVRTEIKCEAIFFRSWTADPQRPLMPAGVQKLLGVKQTPTGMAEAR